MKAKGISERAILEKTAAERPAENVTEKPAETASASRPNRGGIRRRRVKRLPPGLLRRPPPGRRAGGTAPASAAPAEAAERVGRAPRRQRSCARGDRTPARFERWFAASRRKPPARRTAAARSRMRLASRIRPVSCWRAAGPAAAAADPGLDARARDRRFDGGIIGDEAALCRRCTERRSPPPDAAGRDPVPPARSARRGGGRAEVGAANAGPRHGRRRAVGGQIGVSRGIAEIAKAVAGSG